MPTPHLNNSFQHKKGRNSELLLNSFHMSELLNLCKGVPGHLALDAHFSYLHLQSHSFIQYLKLITIGESWNTDRLVNWAQLLLHYNSLVQHPSQIPNLCFAKTFCPWSSQTEFVREQIFCIPQCLLRTHLPYCRERGHSSHPWYKRTIWLI